MIKKKTVSNKKITKPQQPPKQENTFYMYKWENGYTTFVVATSVEQALSKIKKNRFVACPPELQEEKLYKKNISQANPDFILTVSSATEPENQDTAEKSLN